MGIATGGEFSSVRAIAALSVLVCASALFSQTSRPAPASLPPPVAADVLIIHDSLGGPGASGLIVGYNVADLLGHFGKRAKLTSLEQYRSGDLRRFRFGIVLGVDDRTVAYPQALLNDVRESPRPLLWVNGHLSELFADPRFALRMGIRTGGSGMLIGYDRVRYKGKSLLKSQTSLVPLEITEPARAQVFATATGNNLPERPYAVRSGSFWCFADSPFAYAVEGDRYWVFCDLLHDFLGVPHIEERKALVHIEDISVEDSPEQLRSIADLLSRRGIPFQVSLIPIFRDPEKNEEIFLSDRPQFVRAIQYMVSRGGLVVMHGVTHQSRGKSGDDFEFWDSVADRPVQGDPRAITQRKLRLGLAECFRNGIYPVTWETPHYMASAPVYETVARYFNSSYDRIPSTIQSDSGHHVPYPVVDRYGRFIIPECLGYVSESRPDPGLIVANAERLTVVRDGVASFFFHPFMDTSYLETIVNGIQASGYHFVSIRDYDLRLQMQDWLTQTYTDSINFPVHDLYLHRLLLHADGRRSAESYSNRPLATVVRDPGIVPTDAILVMEAVAEAQAQPKEALQPGLWERATAWVQSRFESAANPGTLLSQPAAIVVWDPASPKGDWNNQES